VGCASGLVAVQSRKAKPTRYAAAKNRWFFSSANQRTLTHEKKWARFLGPGFWLCHQTHPGSIYASNRCHWAS